MVNNSANPQDTAELTIEEASKDTDATVRANNQLQDLSLDVADTNPTGGGGGDDGSGSGSGATQVKGGKKPDMEAALMKFDIPEVVLAEYKNLVELLLVTESMDDDERQYWFHILPIMSDEQVQKLRQILVTEQQKLATLDKEYNAQITEINQKRLHEWQGEKTSDRREALEEKEQKHELSEAATEADLLEQLNSV